ncbi:phospholipase [Chitinibacter fontanus]|uniref:Phospholipase n=1 Tax=Chitinibacter fontanus TaxID=1737446 RepID=A0A7D5ZJ22_9NEIS|nr:phospholipase D-like domain-containing protein [Chitinibacter fontanus]QLI82667.1 phospholipase [Chitinibacter fontanus]
MKNDYVVPLCPKDTNTATTTSPWFVQKTEYHPVPTGYQPLINGEAAFGSVHYAIAKATRSVDIICWGFQPSMYFVRKGADNIKYPDIKEPVPAQIGKLLEYKAQQGVQIRVLGWTMGPDDVNFAQWGPENNTPGQDIFSKPKTATKTQHEFDRQWYYERRLNKPANLQFVGRGFGPLDRLEILWRSRYRSADKSISKTTQGVLAATVTHHQKSVLVDYELPDQAIGFVMGHNMLDEYWDKNDHSRIQHADSKHGRNGAGPRQDISSSVTGPILEHLHHNFATAWKAAVGEDLLSQRNAKAVAAKLYPRTGGCALMAQLLRTQSQANKRDIETLYLQAANNATSMIYIENQYFRWPPLAEKIKAAIGAQTNWGRNPPKNGYLHLFVVTNSSDEGMSDGTVNTYRMMDSLGRADTIPGVARKSELDWREEQYEIASKEAKQAQKQVNASAPQVEGGIQFGSITPEHQKNLEQLSAAQQKEQEAKAALSASENKYRQAKKSGQDATIMPEEVPGLKVHICTLVSPDSIATADTTRKQHVYAMGSSQDVDVPVEGQQWTPVYIHSKLMIVNDVFTTHGSANINTRSMEVDSELNIAHEWKSVSQKLRRDLWNLHTKEMGAQDDPAVAYLEWRKIINRNKRRQAQKLQPEASLIEFYRGSPALTNKD